MNELDYVEEQLQHVDNMLVVDESPDRLFHYYHKREERTLHKSDFGKYEDVAEALYLLEGAAGQGVYCARLILKEFLCEHIRRERKQ